jgi:hypothetical protein
MAVACNQTRSVRVRPPQLAASLNYGLHKSAGGLRTCPTLRITFVDRSRTWKWGS